MEFVQVRLLTNMSDPFPKKIVRERLTEFSLLNSVIRRLFGAIAGYSFGERGTVGFFCVRSALSKPLLYSIKVFGREREGDFFPKKFPSQNPKNKPQTTDI